MKKNNTIKDLLEVPVAEVEFEGLTKFPKLYFYTKANLKIGYGHLIRQSILAKFLKMKIVI